MKMQFAPVIAVLALTVSATASAQQFETPRASPNAKITQTVGLTDITVEYSSPTVKGRTIWGELEPWGKVWRAGANATTKITFSKDVTIAGTPVPAGSYALFVIPNSTGPWQIIINKDYLQGGAFNYKQDLDVVRVDATPTPIPMRDRLAYIVADFSDTKANVDLEWEKIRVSLPVSLHTDAQVASGIKSIESGNGDPFVQMADYERLIKQDYEAAMKWVNKSIKMHETWQNVWEKARVEAGMGKNKEAIATLKKAMKLGVDAPPFFKPEAESEIAEWSKK